MGIGETVQDSIASPGLILRAGDLWNRQKTQAILRLVTDLKLSQLGDEIDRCGGSARARAAIATLRDPTWISTAVDVYASLAREASIVEMIDLPIDGHVIFEGAQGVLLDGTHGYHPHTTWSTTTFWNADMLLNQLNWPGDRVRIGVLRNYFTRHGVGPFVTEDNSLHPHLPEPHNDASGWQGKFRVGVFDAAAARYAIEVSGGVDCLAMTHLDRLPVLPDRICDAYDASNHPCYRSIAKTEDGFVCDIEEALNASVAIRSFGPTHADKRITSAMKEFE
jgi:adenylosuccinate synthase